MGVKRRRRRGGSELETPNLQNYLLLEDDFYYLLEDGFKILLEDQPDA